MRIPTTRRALPTSAIRARRWPLAASVAVLALAAALLPSPAQATTIFCDTLLETTPTVHVDMDGDGYPEYRVPRIQDVTLCSDASASYTTTAPRIENCFVGWHPTCFEVYVDLTPVDPQVGASGEICFWVEGARFPTCAGVKTPASLVAYPQTVCMGFDLHGNHPCSGGTIALPVELPAFIL